MKEILREINRRQVGNLGNDQISYEEAAEYIKNPESFAKRILPRESYPSPGLHLTEKTIELSDGCFANMYDLSFPIHDDSLDARVMTFLHPTYQHRLFSKESTVVDGSEKMIATINGAFFYLQDDPLAHGPAEIMYNLNIRNGHIVGLPAATRPALITNAEGDLSAYEIKARGALLCGDTLIEWKGAEAFAHGRETYQRKENQVYVFNAACCTISYKDPADKRSLRELQHEKNKTPLNANCVDVIVNTNISTGTLEVSAINKGGGTDFFSGNFILQGSQEFLQDVTIGSKINVISIDGIDPSAVMSAMTVGPMVHHFLNNDDHEINHDPSLGTFPPFVADQRYARSLIYADTQSKVHLVVFDAVPRSEFMKGVTPAEAARHIPTDAPWAVFLDGGQSSRFTFNDENSDIVDSRGNAQYVRLHKLAKSGQSILKQGSEDQFLWSRKGREVPSVIALMRKK